MTSKLIYKGTAHGHTKTKDRVNITLKIHEETTDYPKLRYDTLEPVTTYKTVSLTTDEIQLINSALSIYYSTRHENNPLKQDALTLKQRFLTIDPNIAEWSHES